MPVDAVLQIDHLVKKYKSVTAVNDVSLRVERAEIAGLIGPDGAGKTTLMRTVATLLKPTSGRVLVAGHDIVSEYPAVRHILGYMPQRFSLYQDLTVEQNLQFFADVFRVPESERAARLKKLYHFSRLEPFRHRAAGALSGGMKQKLALSCALIHRPEVLVLDEPTFGVDPVSRQEFWEILFEIRKEGAGILVSTAYMDEASRCDHVTLMHRGEFIASGAPEEVIRSFPYPLYRITGENIPQIRRFFDGLPTVHSTQLFGDALHVSFVREPAAENWRQWQRQLNGGLREWAPQPPSMEDVFMELMGKAGV